MLGGYGWQNDNLPEVSMPQSLEPSEYVAFHGSRDFVHVIKVEDIEMEDCHGLPGRPHLITQSFKSGEIFQAVVRGRYMKEE